MPERVVDGLEAVQIDEQDRQITSVPLPVRHRIAELLVEQQPVAETRQRIVVRQMHDLACDFSRCSISLRSC